MAVPKGTMKSAEVARHEAAEEALRRELEQIDARLASLPGGAQPPGRSPAVKPQAGDSKAVRKAATAPAVGANSAAGRQSPAFGSFEDSAAPQKSSQKAAKPVSNAGKQAPKAKDSVAARKTRSTSPKSSPRKAGRQPSSQASPKSSEVRSERKKAPQKAKTAPQQSTEQKEVTQHEVRDGSGGQPSRKSTANSKSSDRSPSVQRRGAVKSVYGALSFASAKKTVFEEVLTSGPGPATDFITSTNISPMGQSDGLLEMECAKSLSFQTQSYLPKSLPTTNPELVRRSFHAFVDKILPGGTGPSIAGSKPVRTVSPSSSPTRRAGSPTAQAANRA